MPTEQHPHPLSDLKIARLATITMRPIQEIADQRGLEADHVFPYGRRRAKIEGKYLESLDHRSKQKDYAEAKYC